MNMKTYIVTAICLLASVYAWGHSGVVTAHHDAALENLLYQEKNAEAAPSSESCITATGYRIQFYSSNASRKAKEIAFEWKAKLEEAFPQHRVYVQYQAPFWKVRVGDFTHYAEAVLCCNALKQAYPSEAGEIIVIKEKAVKPIYFKEELTAPTDTLPTIEEQNTTISQ